MSLRKHDIVLIVRGTDFDGNDLSGRKATVINIITPQAVNACIRVEGMSHDTFFLKENLKVIERPEPIKWKK